MVIGSIVCVVVPLMLFVLLKAFAILVECPLVVVQFFAMFFLLAMIRSRLVALLCVRVDVRFSGWFDGVLQYSQFAIHIQVCQLLMLLLVLCHAFAPVAEAGAMSTRTIMLLVAW